MAIVPSGFVKQGKVASDLAKVARKLAPDVVRIRHSIGTDWSGEPSIFFRIVLSDDASREDRLARITGRVTAALLDELKPPELGLLPYFSFRSQSEQAMLKEEAWS